MAATETVSTLGGYKAIHSTNATLVTAISDVIDELETHRISMTNTQYTFTYNSDAGTYTFMAICKTGSAPNT